MSFTYISWEAFATLFTGIIAVAGATTVARNQAKIQERQVENERHRLRIDLFERRYQIYIITKELIAQVLMPNGPVSYDTYKIFRAQLRQVPFLFGKDIGREFDLAWVSIDQIIKFDDENLSHRINDVTGKNNRHVERLESTFKSMTEKMEDRLDLSSIR